MQSREDVKHQMFHHIKQWTVSNLSQKDYCRQHQLTYHSFHYWYKRYKNNDQSRAVASFMQLQVQPQTLQPMVELLLSDGKRILFHQPVSSDYLKALIS